MSHVTPRRVLLGGALFVALLVAALWWRAVAVTRRLLREDAPASIAEKSENVYRVAVGRVGFNHLSRRLSVDTITATTNDSVNAARRVPRTGLRLAFRDCAMRGVRVLKLIFRQGLDAETFGCAAVTAAVDVPRGAAAAPDSSPAQVPGRALFELQRSLRLPASAPQVPGGRCARRGALPPRQTRHRRRSRNAPFSSCSAACGCPHRRRRCACGGSISPRSRSTSGWRAPGRRSGGWAGS